MNKLIDIQIENCISCQKCIKVCPSKVFNINNDVVKADSPERCISCGHCAAICPTNAIIHSKFPSEKVHKINRSLLPSAEQILMLIKSRRSNRTFTNKQIEKENLDLIIEAGYRAPTASNLQQVKFTLITDPEKLKLISQYTIGQYSSIVSLLENPILKPILKLVMSANYKYVPTFKRINEEYQKGNDMILRGATAVLLIHTPKTSKFGCEDSNLAYQNASLMAESLGIAQFYTGFVCNASKMDKKEKLKKALGIDGIIHAGMAMGIPEFKFENYIDKKDIQLNRL